MSEQHNKNGKSFFFLFSFLSPLSSLLSPLSSLYSFFSHLSFFLIHSYQPLLFPSFTLFSFLLLLFSLPLSLTTPPPQPDVDLYCCGFFFLFFSVIWWVCSAVGGFKWWWADWWWWVAMSRFSGGWVGLWVGCDGDRQIGGGGFWCTNSVVGGAACAWALMDGLAVGRLAAAVGGFVFFFFCFFFFFSIKDRQWFCFGCEVILGVYVVLCCDGFGVRRWWGGIWGVDGCWQRGWCFAWVVIFFFVYCWFF